MPSTNEVSTILVTAIEQATAAIEARVTAKRMTMSAGHPKPVPPKRSVRKKKLKQRIYWRSQGGQQRAYGDFRDLGGKREALLAPGETRATTDPDVAAKLVGARLEELLGKKRDKAFGVRPATPLKAYAAHHLEEKAKSGNYSELWLVNTEHMLTVAVEHFGADRDIGSISVEDVQQWATVLSARSNGRGGTLSRGTIRHHLNVVSSLYDRAQSESKVDLGYSPIARMLDKPAGNAAEAKWLLVHEAALLLEAARTFVPKRPDVSLPFIHPLVATFLLTGGREAEVLGLEVTDINFDNATLTFRPNAWRRLKTKKSHRTIPLWPQLATILKDYVRSTGRKSGLLFPSPLLAEPGMIRDFRKVLDAVAERTGVWKAGDIRSKMFRHTYASARLQTLKHGEPVTVFDVSRELGHATTALVEETYGHTASDAHRSDVVEYRVAQHRAKLKTHLKLLKSA